jgi:lysozyme family protein
MNHDFDSSLAFVLVSEGGLSHDSADHGGLTNYGITQATYSAWLKNHGLPDTSVSEITVEYAKAIYLEVYWNGAGCDKLVSPLNLVAFDSAVNHGVGATKGLLKSALAFPGASLIQVTFALLVLRDNLYRRIVGRDPTQDKFLKGWMNRLGRLRKTAGL